MKTEVNPVVVDAVNWYSKEVDGRNIKKVSVERATMTEIQTMCMLGSARILRKVPVYEQNY